MACTYTLIDATGKEITLNGPAEFKAYLAETGLNQFYPDAKYPWSPKAAEIEPSTQIDFKAAQAFAERLINGESFKTIIQARKALTTQAIESGTALAKQADEAIELAGVLAGRKIIDKGMSQADTFDALAKIADQMPSLNVRTSESIAQQAYSTPLPLAYVASVRAGITKQTTVVEPTAGNGALVMAANPELTTVNELNKSRFDALKEQGFDATNEDAVNYNFGRRDADVVIANPPFGVIKDEDNKTITFHIAGGYNTNEIDHAIALSALKAMGENGKAVLIVGGPSKMLSDEKRSDAYNGKAKRSFYFTLYNQYNVTDHFTVSGDLYAKQGAAWPVDVIVIDGVGKSQLKLPAANLPRIINSIEELKNELEGNKVSMQQAPVSVEQATRSQTETGDEGRDLAIEPSADTESDQNRQPYSVLHGLRGYAEGNGGDGEYLRQQNDNISGRPARVNKPTDTVENKFQANYRPGSSVNPVGTLVPVNMQSSIESALQRIIDKHGDLDSYVANLLDYPLQDIGKYFSAEQVDAISLALDNIENGKGFIIGDQCVAGHTMIFDPVSNTHNTIKSLAEQGKSINVLAMSSNGEMVPAWASVPFKKGKTTLYKVVLANGKQITVTDQHRFLSATGWKSLKDGIVAGDVIACAHIDHYMSHAADYYAHQENVMNYLKITQDFQGDYQDDFRSCDEQPQFSEDSGQALIPSPSDAQEHIRRKLSLDDSDSLYSDNLCELLTRLSKNNFFPLESRDHELNANQERVCGELLLELIRQEPQQFVQWLKDYSTAFQARNHQTDFDEAHWSQIYYEFERQILEGTASHDIGSFAFHQQLVELLSLIDKGEQFANNIHNLVGLIFSFGDYTGWTKVLSIEDVGEDDFYDMWVPGYENYTAEGLINHNTGVGKGRVNAAMIRYGIKNNITPIFVTEKSNLYGDMVRDLTDIGMENIKPFATNSGASIPMDKDGNEWFEKKLKAQELGEKAPAKYGKFLEFGTPAKQNKLMANMINQGKLIDADVIFTTYSQMQTVKGAETERMKFLESMGDNALLILDESHNAGGGAVDKKGESIGRAAMARKLVSIAKGVFYSSATYAKRPDVLDLYSKTDMGLIANPDVLQESLIAGGVPLQQAVASMLAKSGQYIRREKSFDGIVYETSNVEVNKNMAEKSSEIMREIMKFDELKQRAVKEISKELKAEAGTIRSDMATGSVGASSANFSSVMHNMIGQMLLLLKTKPAIDEAISALKRGEKPVITLSNTMGSVISEYAEDTGLNVGDVIDLDVGYLLKRYANKSKRVSIGDAYGKKETRELTNEELGPLAVRQFNKIIKLIDSFDFSEFPISPIDYIHNELEKAGYKSNEITGRTAGVDYSKGEPTYKIRSGQEKTPAGKRKIINDFNNGKIDVIILNQSGSTGISLHSSPKVGGDTRKRHMIVAQPELNIDTHMQMLGRVNRTGQLNLPSYSQLAADIPAEKRPSAILAKKMAMLNANTTAGKESAVKAKDVPDFMNQYGDEVVASIMRDNPEIHKILGEPLGSDFDKEGAIAKVSGRIPVLSLKEQDALYQAIEDEYNDYIDMLTKTGENQLEAHAMDLQAKTINDQVVVEPIGDSDSPFAEPVIAKTVDVKKLGKPYTSQQIKELINKQGITDGESKQKALNSFLEKSKSEYELASAEIEKMDDSDQLAIDRKNSAIAGLRALHENLDQMYSNFMPGGGVLITSPNGVQYLGITGKFEKKGAGKNYFAQGQWKVTIYVADAAKQLVIPLSKLSTQQDATRWTIEKEPIDTVKQALEEGQSSTREQRTILTGNMLAAYGFNKTGQIVNYTDDAGEIHQGVLMPKKFDLKQAIEAKPIIFDSPDMAIEFVNDMDVSIKSLRSSDNEVKLIISNAGNNLYVPASKAKGSVYFNNKRLTDLLGNFYKRGSEMVVRVPHQDVQEVIRALYPIAGSMQPVSKDQGKAFFEKKGIKYSKSAKTTGSTVAEIKSMLPGRVKKLVDTGKLKIIATSDKGVEAYYDTKNDVLVLMADMLNKDNFGSVLAHELYHRAEFTDAKTKAAIDKFENQLRKQFELARGGEGSAIEQRAAQRVIEANTPVTDRLEEFGAYLVAEYKNLPVDLKKILGDFIAAIRMTLLRHGLDMGFIKTLTPADLYALSKYGANAKATPVSKTAKIVSPTEKNIPETIDVDGIQRPTRNSNGQLIHQTQDNIRNFWRWFGDSKIVDENGRPIPMYHGTPKRFQQPVFKTNTGALLGNGAYFTSNIKESDQYANNKGEAPTIYSVYLKVENPKVTNRFLERVEKQRIRDTNDGVEFNKPNTNDKWVVTFKPEQIKSLDNFGEFSETNPDIRYSKQFTDLQNKAIDAIQNQIKSSKTFNKWHLTVGTQHHKALINKDFGNVFEASLNFENDTARLANESADYAPSLLPKTESLSEVAKEVVGKGFKRIKDAKKIADAIFETTLSNTPMTDAELEAAGYSDEQRTMYAEFFSAVNHSLDELAKSEMFRLARSLKLDIASQSLSLRSTAKFYTDQLTKQEDIDLFNGKVKQIENLQSNGYAPLMRFGKFTVDAVNQETGDREFFGMFETEAEANEMAKALADEYPDTTISQGILSQKSWEMFKGVTPETMEAFAKMMNVEQDEAFQMYLAMAVNNRSAMKRLIKRKKIPGFAKDPQRILASFVTSNARAASKNYNLGKLVTAISEIDKRKGDVIDEAVDMYNFVQNPSEAGSQVRGLLFAWYLGGSFASAMVNTTQTLTTTLPYLHQFGSTKQVAGILSDAMKLAANKNVKALGGDLGMALRRAEEEGVTAPHELHMLYGESMRTSMASNAMIRPLQKAWGSLFSLTEGYNRRVAFIAAYKLAKENQHANPFKFAEDAVNQTQFIYSKSSRPNWARGAVGSTLFTFKTFTINYLEFLKRLPTQERLIALGVLILMSGLSGLPGSDDADDILDTVGQYLGYNTNTKEWKEKIINDMLGKEAGQFALHGISSFLPIDISSRLSVGNVIPGTAILKKSETDKTRDVMEFAGAAGSLAQKGVQAFTASQGREGVIGKAQAIAHAALPKALADAYQALDMVQTGYYRDYKGKNVQKVNEADALFKLLGLQPTKVSEPKQRERMVQQDIAMTKAVEADIADLWADGVYEKNPAKVKEAKEMLSNWNRKNPETPIKVKMTQIMKRVKAMKQTSGQRLMKTAPKELRRFAKESLSD